MTKNNDPEVARRAQDVVGHPRRESTNSTHVGRGGAANVFKPTEKEIEVAKRDNARWESAVVDDGKAEKGLADRGKEFLSGLVGGKK